jgi:hypothetical protein
VRYELKDLGSPTMGDILDKFLDRR